MLSGNFYGLEIWHGIFWGLNFGPGIFLGFVWGPGIFGGFSFLPPFNHPFHLKSKVHPLGGRWGNPLRWGNKPVFIISHYFQFDHVYMIGGVSHDRWGGVSSRLPHRNMLPPPPPCNRALTCSVGNHIPKAISSHWTAVLALLGAAQWHCLEPFHSKTTLW